MKQQLLADLHKFTAFLRSMEQVTQTVWYKPLSTGGWSIHDIVTHIMRWDHYFNTVTYPAINQSTLPELNEHQDYLSFNEQSIEYAKAITRFEILDETIRNRQALITNLEALEDHQFTTIYPGEQGFTLEAYLTKFFTSHDRHHMDQIQEFLQSQRALSNRIMSPYRITTWLLSAAFTIVGLVLLLNAVSIGRNVTNTYLSNRLGGATSTEQYTVLLESNIDTYQWLGAIMLITGLLFLLKSLESMHKDRLNHLKSPPL